MSDHIYERFRLEENFAFHRLRRDIIQSSTQSPNIAQIPYSYIEANPEEIKSNKLDNFNSFEGKNLKSVFQDSCIDPFIALIVESYI